MVGGAGSTQTEVTVTGEGMIRTTQKFQEKSTVVVPEWLGIGRIIEWLVDLIRACQVCTGRTDELERYWIKECERASSKEDDFVASWPRKAPRNSPEGDAADAQRFNRLDRTLAIALTPFDQTC